MGKINVTRTELVWPGKYREDGTHRETPRVNLPFQVIETVNESHATREARKTMSMPLFDAYAGTDGPYRRTAPGFGVHRSLIPGPARLPFPDFLGTTGALRLLAALLAALRFLRLAIPCLHPILRSRASSDVLRAGLDFGTPAPSGSPGLETTSSPRFLGHPLRICPALRPRPGRRAKPFGTPVLPPSYRQRRPQRITTSFEAQSHSFCGHCLRFTVPVAPDRRKTRFRLPLRFTGWDWLPTGWLRMVSDATSHHPPFPDLAWRPPLPCR